MADEFTKIKTTDYTGVNKLISELPDSPTGTDPETMTAGELKQRFDALDTDVVIPKFNNLVDEIQNWHDTVTTTMDADVKAAQAAATDAAQSAIDAAAAYTNVDDKIVSTFTASTDSFPVPTPGDTIKVIMGKVVKWFADCLLYITALLSGIIATIENSTTASQAYVVGDFFIYNKHLYIVTAGITASGTISPGTNCDQTTIGAQLTKINSNSAYPNAGAHNSIFRGKNITANVTDGSFYTHIKDGTFEDIYVGDYFTKSINGTNYVIRIAGCDVYLHRGDPEFTSHHVVVVPDGSFGTYAMNSSNTTSGGYVGSAMYTSTLVTWAGYLATAFGSNLLTNRELLTNAISGELPSNRSWYDSKVNLMTSEEVVGHGGFGMSGYNYGFNVGIACGQLPLFRLAPDKICNRTVYWLRTIISSLSFAVVGYGGDLSASNASSARELRPRFLLG